MTAFMVTVIGVFLLGAGMNFKNAADGDGSSVIAATFGLGIAIWGIVLLCR